jgi:hypothetical protein
VVDTALPIGAECGAAASRSVGFALKRWLKR